MTTLDRLQKARLEVNALKNTASRALYAIDKAIDELDAEPEPQPDPVEPEPEPTPEPQPDPEPVPLPETPTAEPGEIRTQTGAWKVEYLDGGYKVGDEHVITREPTSSGVLDEEWKTFGGVSFAITQGSVRCAGTPGPEATPERMLQAITDRRIIPYSMVAFDGWAKAAPTKAEPETPYRPDLFPGRSSSNNVIAYGISGQAGEYGSSRGFLATDDAHLVMGAVDGNEAQFAHAAKDCFSDVLYGLALPHLAIWSKNAHCLRDPQFPFDGDRPYVNAGSRTGADNYGNEGKIIFPADHPYLAELNATAGTAYTQVRDTSHLFNHGFAYWCATGDWRAGLLQQAIAAYALASVYQGPYKDRYRTRFGYQRWTINMLTAAWKLRDVALYASGDLLWSKERSLKMVSDVMADWKAQIAAMDSATDIYNRASSIFRGVDNGVTASDNAYSNFMLQIYAPETAYLWASAGEPLMLQRLAENMVLRFLHIGGTRGVYGKGSGSGFKLIENNTLPYDDADGLVRWTNDGNALPNDSFDGAAQHTVQRAYWTLKFAEDAIRRGWLAPVPGVPEAIAAMETCRTKAPPKKDLAVVSAKHGGVPFHV